MAVHSQVVDAGEAMSNIKVTEKVFNQYAERRRHWKQDGTTFDDDMSVSLRL